MLKMRHIIDSLLVIATVIIVLGIAANVACGMNPRPEPPMKYKIDSIKGLFGGEIVPIALNPQPEPPKIWKIEMNAGRGIFSGELPYCWSAHPPLIDCEKLSCWKIEMR